MNGRLSLLRLPGYASLNIERLIYYCHLLSTHITASTNVTAVYIRGTSQIETHFKKWCTAKSSHIYLGIHIELNIYLPLLCGCRTLGKTQQSYYPSITTRWQYCSIYDAICSWDSGSYCDRVWLDARLLWLWCACRWTRRNRGRQSCHVAGSHYSFFFFFVNFLKKCRNVAREEISRQQLFLFCWENLDTLIVMINSNVVQMHIRTVTQPLSIHCVIVGFVSEMFLFKSRSSPVFRWNIQVFFNHQIT